MVACPVTLFGCRAAPKELENLILGTVIQLFSTCDMIDRNSPFSSCICRTNAIMVPKGSFPVAHHTVAPKGSFPVKPDGSFPTTQMAHYDGSLKKSAKGSVKTISRSLKMMNLGNLCKDSTRAVYPMSGQGCYDSLVSMRDDDDDTLPLLEYVESRDENTLDFSVETC